MRGFLGDGKSASVNHTASTKRARGGRSAAHEGRRRRCRSGRDTGLLTGCDLHLADQPLAEAYDLAPLRGFRPAHEKILERGWRALRQGAHQASGGEIIACQARARQRDTLSPNSRLDRKMGLAKPRADPDT